MEDWWDHLSRFQGRDQPALGYLMWKSGIHPAVMPARLGPRKNNELFATSGHKASNAKQSAGVQKAHSSRNKRRLAWICSDTHGDPEVPDSLQVASLDSLLTKELPHFGSTVVTASEVEQVRGALLVLSPAYLAECQAEALEKLRTAGNTLCFFHDHSHSYNGSHRKYAPELDEYADVNLADSVGAFVFHKQRQPLIPAYHITRLFDSGLTAQKQHSCRIGCFLSAAEVAHTALLNETLNQQQPADVDNASNVHYAVNNHEAGNLRPFTEGFLAAHNHANLIVRLDEGDARYYVGSDYPYGVHDPSKQTVAQMLDYVRESYNSKEWLLALEIMASVRHRSGPTQTLKDLKNFLAAGL
jgi:hypothetical protein